MFKHSEYISFTIFFRFALYFVFKALSWPLNEACHLFNHNRRDSLTLTLTSGPQFLINAISQIAKFMGPTWGPPGSCRHQMGPMWAPWALLSGLSYSKIAMMRSMVPNLSPERVHILWDILYFPLCFPSAESRGHSGYGVSKWDEGLKCNAFAHWLSP